MDFWREMVSGKLYVHGRICYGLCPDGDSVEGALIHEAKDHKPIWMPWAFFKTHFEHVELRTSQEAWESGAHWYWMLGCLSCVLGGGMFFMLVMFAWEGVATRPSAWPVSIIFICASALAFRRSNKLADNYQWHSWKRELKEEPVQ